MPGPGALPRRPLARTSWLLAEHHHSRLTWQPDKNSAGLLRGPRPTALAEELWEEKSQNHDQHLACCASPACGSQLLGGRSNSPSPCPGPAGLAQLLTRGCGPSVITPMLRWHPSSRAAFVIEKGTMEMLLWISYFSAAKPVD
ncbi:neudesin isoform X3 [Tyto alba]|uniref:neudesin isoform X3 n=1 Tax=Tyto alba TaxID=56313 RepID=UPI001C67367E|nr:neudesin isoform X3 [Tyto alba]